ncbi:hypothetical protein OROMI_015357 [Orobanche minor]
MVPLGGVDASQGSSGCKSFKKKKHASRLQKGTDVSEGDMAGDSGCHQDKRKRVEEESFSCAIKGCKDVLMPPLKERLLEAPSIVKSSARESSIRD